MLPKNLSENFTLTEATKSQEATRRGLDNTPSPEIFERMQAVCEAILEPVRAHFKKPVLVNSFYRAPAVNAAIGSKDTSQHTKGEAVDFEVPGIDNDDLAKWVRDNLEFDQLIREFPQAGIPDSGWVHASYKESGRRKECLTISKSGTVKGLA